MKKIVLALMLLSICGCSIFGGRQVQMGITSSERAAQIFINGMYQGNGIVQTSVSRDENVSVLVKKDGFYPSQREITTKLSSLGMLDAIFGCVLLVPWIGLAFPGAWIPEQTNVTILLDRK